VVPFFSEVACYGSHLEKGQSLYLYICNNFVVPVRTSAQRAGSILERKVGADDDDENRWRDGKSV
jgi:hypothetical protein